MLVTFFGHVTISNVYSAKECAACEFHELSSIKLAPQDIAEVNLECATDLRGSEDLNIPAAISKLNHWAEAVRTATVRH